MCLLAASSETHGKTTPRWQGEELNAKLRIEASGLWRGEQAGLWAWQRCCCAGQNCSSRPGQGKKASQGMEGPGSHSQFSATSGQPFAYREHTVVVPTV